MADPGHGGKLAAMRLHGAAAALLLAACVPAGRPEPPQELRVLVYNIHAGKDAARIDNLRRVAEIIRGTKSDLVLLQEVDSATTRSGRVDQLSVLGAATGMHQAFGNTLSYQGGGFGNALLSRFPIVHHVLVPLSPDSVPGAARVQREPRGALVAVVTTPRGPLHVVNTHLDAGRDDRWRRHEAAQIVQLTDSLKGAGARLILGGDLNSTPEAAVQDLLRQGGLQDVWPHCGRGGEMTFPAKAPVKRIDYLYALTPSACTEARVLETTASDHRPLLVTLRLP